MIIDQELQKKAHTLRFTERCNRFLGGVSLAFAGFWGALIVGELAHYGDNNEKYPSDKGSIAELVALGVGITALSRSFSQGRQADVIDAELLQRSRPAISPNNIAQPPDS